MFTSVKFENFRALRDATLPLGPFTLLLGANGSGKSTALLGIRSLPDAMTGVPEQSVVTAGTTGPAYVTATTGNGLICRVKMPKQKSGFLEPRMLLSRAELSPIERCLEELRQCRFLRLVPAEIAGKISVAQAVELTETGANLGAVLNQLLDTEPERFEQVNASLRTWLPEFDRILFQWSGANEKTLQLRTARGGHRISATELSDGVLLSLVFLTLAHIPSPPPLLALEEPEHGLHPRMLRDVRDALYRLAYPKDYGEDREPIQVIVTTHSPYFVDLFKDRPEEIVIAVKDGHEAHFERLKDRPDIKSIIGDMPLGEAWYSGVLGGVPDHT